MRTHRSRLTLLAMLVLFAANAVLVWLRHYSISWLGERVAEQLQQPGGESRTQSVRRSPTLAG